MKCLPRALKFNPSVPRLGESARFFSYPAGIVNFFKIASRMPDQEKKTSEGPEGRQHEA
jgi:hypothetical protein